MYSSVSIVYILVYGLFIFWLIAHKSIKYRAFFKHCSRKEICCAGSAAVAAFVTGYVLNKYDVLDISSVGVVLGAGVAASIAYMSVETIKESRLREERASDKKDLERSVFAYIDSIGNFESRLAEYENSWKKLEGLELENKEAMSDYELKEDVYAEALVSRSFGGKEKIKRYALDNARERLSGSSSLLRGAKEELISARACLKAEYNNTIKMLNTVDYCCNVMKSQVLTKEANIVGGVYSLSEKMSDAMEGVVDRALKEDKVGPEDMLEISIVALQDLMEKVLVEERKSFENSSLSYRDKLRFVYCVLAFIAFFSLAMGMDYKLEGVFH